MDHQRHGVDVSAIQQVLLGLGTGAAGGDPYFAFVRALLHGEGANNGTVITDVKGHTFSAGNAVTSTTQYKYGSSSLKSSGTGAQILSATHADFSFGANDFTIECWFYPTTFALQAGFKQRLMMVTDGSGNHEISLGYDSSGNIVGYVYDNAYIIPNTFITSQTANLNAWNHAAFVRNGVNHYVFINGQTPASLASSSAYTLSTQSWKLAVGYSGINIDAPMQGYMDEVRITAYARYVAAFTPPSLPFPDS